MTETMVPETREQWQEILQQFLDEQTPEDAGDGLEEPADESALVDLESRLGERLPVDYRNFLLVSDGCEVGDLYRMWPVEDVGWARDVMPDMIEAWEDFEDEVEMLQRCLVVGADESNTFYLLDPATVSGAEGWTAIEWWTTPSEVSSYTSFGALVSGLIRPAAD